MGVRRVGLIALTTMTALSGRSALAADVPQPPMIVQQQVVEEFSNWYLRGDVGIGIMRNYQLEYLRNPANNNNFQIEHSSIGDAFFIGAGVGYELNNWLRLDVTAEYRAKTPVYAFGSYTDGAGGVFLDTYQGYFRSWVFLANTYVDLGTWWCFTPFVGAGIGGARNSIVSFTDVGIPTAGRGFGRDTSDWQLAWALHAGVAYNVTKNFKVELAYRYLNMGSITETIDCVGGCNPDSYKFRNMYSHDIKLGLRWTCCELPVQQQYTYTQPYMPPPPVYAPPLRSRG